MPISRNLRSSVCVTLTAALLALLSTPVHGQQKPGKRVGNFFKTIAGQPRDTKKVGLSFSSVHGVEIYYPIDWASQEKIPEGWELMLRRQDTEEATDIHMIENQAYSLDQVLVDETEALRRTESLKNASEGTKRKIGDYKNIPGLEATYFFGKNAENMRHVVYFGYPPYIHSLILDCSPAEYERLKPDFDHILSTISIHDGVH